MLNKVQFYHLPALRRLHFPFSNEVSDKQSDKSTQDTDDAARTYLAALGLLGAVLSIESGYDLRSRCSLQATNAIEWELLGKPGEPSQYFLLDKQDAIELYNEALRVAQSFELPIHVEEIKLFSFRRSS